MLLDRAFAFSLALGAMLFAPQPPGFAQTLSAHAESAPLPAGKSWPHAAAIVIHDVNVVDVVTGSLRSNSTVVIKDGRIAAVAAAAHVRTADARLIDGRGRYLIPGLWDMHSHSLWSPQVLRTFLPLYVANGVTGIRDMGGRLDLLATYREQANRGNPAYPRVIAAGPVLDGPKPVHAEISIAVADAADATRAVQELANAGVDFIKTYTLLPREAYFQVVAEAKRVGLPVAGHVPASVTVEEAARAGQRSIEHLREEIAPFCSSTSPAACKQLATLFRQTRTWQVPTLVTLHGKAHFDEAGLASDPRLKYLPVDVRTDWLKERAAKMRRGDDYSAGKKKLFAEEVWLTRFLALQGVGILAGSDAGVAFCYPGFSLHDELQHLVDAGMSPIQALRAATLSPAEFLGARDTLGSIETGRAADMVLLRANPLAKISATREIEMVFVRGHAFTRQDLDAMLAQVERDASAP